MTGYGATAPVHTVTRNGDVMDLERDGILVGTVPIWNDQRLSGWHGYLWYLQALRDVLAEGCVPRNQPCPACRKWISAWDEDTYRAHVMTCNIREAGL